MTFCRHNPGMKTISALRISLFAATLALAACGGGGNAGSTQAPLPPTQSGPTVSLDASTFRTIAGGVPVTLKASVSDSTAVSWKLAAGAPGSLSAGSGASINYQPPAGGVSARTAVQISASAGGTSEMLTLELSPDPGAPGLSLIAGHPLNWPWDDSDGTGADAAFSTILHMAADGSGNLYAFTRQVNNQPAYRLGPPKLRKIGANGTVTTLIAASVKDGAGTLVGTWADKPGVSKYWHNITFISGTVADRAGNIYISTIEGNSYSPNYSAIYKLSASGEMSLFAGVNTSHTSSVKDGTGADADFLFPSILGVDGDGNVYVKDEYQDKPTVFRKITPSAKVTTIAALPAGLNADQAGNTYRYDSTQHTVIRKAPDGVETTVAGTAGCTTPTLGSLPGCLNIVSPGNPLGAGPIIPLGGASFAIASDRQTIVRIVVPH